MDNSPDPAVAVLPRTVQRTTPFQPRWGIICPAGDPIGQELARGIAAALMGRGAAEPEIATDLDLLPRRSTPLGAAWRQRPLVLLGSLPTNRALQPLYADYLCATDAAYPGDDGHDLRTIVNPWGTGANVLLVGGSTPAGVAAAAARLQHAIASVPPGGDLPFLLDVRLAPALAARLAAWPFTPLDDPPALQALRNRSLLFFTEPIRVIGAYTLMWWWTADPRYAAIARDTLLALNQRLTDGYGDWHYLAERFLRAVPLLAAGGWLDGEDLQRTERNLLLTALANQGEWWRMRSGRPPLGHRHQGKGTYEFLLLARHLRDQARPTPALRAQCDRWIAECCDFLDGLARAGLDDQDDETTLNNLATLYRYALGQERHEFFTSGQARAVAWRCLALHDGNGNGAGQGGYGEGQGMYLHQEATTQVAAAAFYYDDPALRRVLGRLPHLALPQRYSFLHYTPVFVQQFAAVPTLPAEPPARDRAVTWLPATPHQWAISEQPPLHVEPAGHLVNAPETWLLPEGVGRPRVPRARVFDKLVLRDDFTPDSTYLLVQGYQGGFRWQGHMQAANCIVRFFQDGHVWLVQNTPRHSHHDKNGLAVGEGALPGPMPPFAERVASADFARHALTVSRLDEFRGAAWTRHLFWSRAGRGCFVVIDRATFVGDGEHALTCTWRTPGFASLEGRRWRADQGHHRFTLVAADPVESTSAPEPDQGACEPWVLRQRRFIRHRAGDETSFQNLFYVRPRAEGKDLDLRRLDDRSALVCAGGANTAWVAAEVTPAIAWLPGSTAAAVSLWAAADAIVLAGATRLDLPGLALQATGPAAVCVDLAAGKIALEPDEGVQLTLRLADDSHTLDSPTRLPLPATWVHALRSRVDTWLRSLPAPDGEPPRSEASTANSWPTAWAYDPGTRIALPTREVCVTTDPLPVDRSPEQLLDPVLPDGYSREIWRQWPEAPEYRLSLEFPQPRSIAALHLLGDCRDDPTLRSFHPLPDGIIVEAETADGAKITHAPQPAPDRCYKRYRDAENRLEVRCAQIGQTVRRLHVRIPAPPGGNPLVLHRVELMTGETAAPPVTHWAAADLDGDGREEVALVNAARELIVLGADGRERWRRLLAAPATHLSAQPLDAGGAPVLCAGLLGGDLLLLEADGRERARLPLAARYAALRDCLFGWYGVTHSLAVWHRDPAGRGALAVGGYGIVLFLNADGDLIGHAFSDGPWNFDILVAPPRGDLLVRCGWNHGIQCYDGVPGGGPSGESHSFGGFRQPMFRMLRKVVPFVNGRSLAAAWTDLADTPAGAAFFAAELGCGVFDADRRDWRWKVEGGWSLTAAALQPNVQSVWVGGADGYLLELDLRDGRVRRSRHAGAPVVGLAPLADGGLLAATATGVLRLDRDLRVRNEARRPIRRTLPIGPRALLLEREDHLLELMQDPDAS